MLKNYFIMKRQRLKKIKLNWINVALMIFVIYIAYFIIYKYVFLLSITRYRLVESFVTKRNDSKIFVLFWTRFFGIKYWRMGSETIDEEYLTSINCPVTNCILTHNKKLLKAPHFYDALVFHAAEPWLSPLPETRSPQQYYIMATLEGPAEVRHNLELDAYFYNLTMTYRLDSDILWNYGKIIDRETNELVAPGYNVKWRNPENAEEDKEIHSLLKKKTKTAAWFVSHCSTYSKREYLVKEIQRFMDVDIYGQCGPLKCPLDSSEICYMMLNTTYYFYFSFENALCNDYVTEKVYKNLDLFVVPVVFNGVTNMNNFFPPGSYIDVNNFDSSKELSEYLKFLIENPKEYLKYFWWKKYYKVDNDIEKKIHVL